MCLSASMSCQGDNLLAGNASLLRDLPFERESCMNTGAVGGDVYQRPIADLAQSRILGDEHVLVFLEGTFDFVEQLFRCFRFVLAMAVGGRPDEPAGVLGFRRDAVEDTQPKASIAGVALVGTLANVAGARKLQDAGR